MSFKVEISADTHEELKQKVASLALALGFGGFVEEPTPKEKRGRKPKEEKVAEAPTETPPAETVAPTLEAATALLKKVNDTKGLPAAREILTLVGANRMSEVPAEKYADVVAACEKLLA